MRSTRLAAAVFAAGLVLTACDDGTEVDTPEIDEPAPGGPGEEATEAPEADPAPEDPDATPEPAPEPDDAAGDDPVDEDPEEATSDPGDDGSDGVEPLPGTPGTDLVEDEGEPGELLAVTDVRIGTHEGFDRVVLELEGDGTAGWFVQYDEPRAQGSGEPVSVAGDASLSVALSHLTLPPELPEDIDHWFQQEQLGPEGGVVLEVRDDTVYEGMHLFFVGLDERRPFLVERFDDPQRVVIDVFHE
ncbi:AMIN-like domain-containing (lipo)protein [Egicoccus halophilus]|uniref:AMIN-like domain-containing protein n=1 Tax=Egicoccus halophilus TaxID=1670830 RepID=A0A8J3A9C9_9ACTN|nr:hypothetical protein [Egicoccus halophilus]GGI05056.1 hypothetical protein GCM10011354_12190 [Egicoccus halophilus]